MSNKTAKYLMNIGLGIGALLIGDGWLRAMILVWIVMTAGRFTSYKLKKLRGDCWRPRASLWKDGTWLPYNAKRNRYRFFDTTLAGRDLRECLEKCRQLNEEEIEPNS